jgi:hypothetical protein
MMHPLQSTLLGASRIQLWEPFLWSLAFAAPWALPGHALIVNEMAIVALFALSLDLILGYAGVVSLGHAAFLGFGAYTAALFAKWVHPDPITGLLVGMAAASALGANQIRPWPTSWVWAPEVVLSKPKITGTRIWVSRRARPVNFVGYPPQPPITRSLARPPSAELAFRRMGSELREA